LLEPWLTAFMEKLFAAHGASTYREGNWVVVDNGNLLSQVRLVRETNHPDQSVLQADFILGPQSGEIIIESIVGIGHDRASALADAAYAFQQVVFPAAFWALLLRACAHAHEEEWQIAEIPRTVTSGQLGTRGELPVETWPATFQAIVAQLKGSGLPPGLHWVRYFHQHSPGSAPVTELLLDNQPWHQLHQEAVDLPWPGGDKFYSVRLFFIIQD
jgi:hypothetical protein